MYFFKILLLLPIFMVFSCDTFDGVTKVDSYSGMTKSDYKKGLIRDKNKSSSIDVAEIPKIDNDVITLEPEIPVISNNKLISMSITNDTPIKDILIELSRQANIDMEIDPEIKGGVILKVTNKPLPLVIDRICELANLRYRFTNGIMKFEKDTPYMKNYVVDYIHDNDIWTEVKKTISSIITEDSMGYTDNNTLTSLAGGAQGGASGGTTQQSSQTQQTGTGGSGASSSGGGGGGVYANVKTGIVTVFATNKTHRKIAEFLHDAKKNYSSEVLIEAKVLEVSLSDEFQFGINWNNVLGSVGSVAKDGIQSVGSSFGVVTPPSGFPSVGKTDYITAQISNTGLDLNALVGAMESFGTTRALSSPRLLAMNGQKATLKFTDNEKYLVVQESVNVVQGNTGNTTQTASTLTINEVPVGVEIEITPSINLAKNEATLVVKPTLSVISKELKDPRPNYSAIIPVIQKREINTMLKIKSGNTMIIGGLIKENVTHTKVGVPFLKDVPILGYLFGRVAEKKSVVETIILIKATIVDADTGMSKKDREIYDKFTINKNEESDYLR